MGNLTESASYDSGVYQLETADPVQGGAAGVSNAPLKNLANRTAYLKQHMDAIENGTYIPAAVAPINSPLFTGDPRAPTPALGDSDTSIATSDFVQKTVAGVLNKSVAGGSNVTLSLVEWGNGIWILSGALTANIDLIVPTPVLPAQKLVINRTSGAYTVRVKTPAGAGIYISQGKQQEIACDGTNVIAATNDLADIILDGAPTLTNTPAMFDNSQKVINSAFLKRRGNEYADSLVLTVNTTLTAADAGKLIIFGAANLTVTMPAASSVSNGGMFRFFSVAAGGVLNRAGADTFNFNGAVTGTGCALNAGDTLEVARYGAIWEAVGGSVQAPYAAAMAGSNFQTAAQFSNDSKLATTEFVQRALGNIGATLGLSGPDTLLPSHAGRLISLTNTSGNWTLSLPLLSAVPEGATYTLINTGGGTVQIARQSTDFITTNGGTLTAIPLGTGDFLSITKVGTFWFAAGSAALKYAPGFAGSLSGGTGWQRLPSGLYIQWASNVSDGAGLLTFNFPIAFPSTFSCVTTTTSAGSAVASLYTTNRSQITFQTYRSTDGAIIGNLGFYMIALGY